MPSTLRTICAYIRFSCSGVLDWSFDASERPNVQAVPSKNLVCKAQRNLKNGRRNKAVKGKRRTNNDGNLTLRALNAQNPDNQGVENFFPGENSEGLAMTLMPLWLAQDPSRVWPVLPSLRLAPWPWNPMKLLLFLGTSIFPLMRFIGRPPLSRRARRDRPGFELPGRKLPCSVRLICPSGDRPRWKSEERWDQRRGVKKRAREPSLILPRSRSSMRLCQEFRMHCNPCGSS